MKYVITKIEMQRQPGGGQQAFCYVTWTLDEGAEVLDCFPITEGITQPELDAFIEERAVSYIDAEFTRPAPGALVLEPSLVPVDIDIEQLKRKGIGK